MEVRDHWRKIVFAPDPRNAIKRGRKRRESFLFDRSLIHAGGVVIANLLINRAALGIIHRRFLENVAQDKAIALREFGVAAIRALVRRNRILLEPSAA